MQKDDYNALFVGSQCPYNVYSMNHLLLITDDRPPMRAVFACSPNADLEISSRHSQASKVDSLIETLYRELPPKIKLEPNDHYPLDGIH